MANQWEISLSRSFSSYHNISYLWNLLRDERKLSAGGRSFNHKIMERKLVSDDLFVSWTFRANREWNKRPTCPLIEEGFNRITDWSNYQGYYRHWTASVPSLSYRQKKKQECSNFRLSALPGWYSGERVGLMTWWLWVRSSVKATFFSAYFRFSPLQKHVRKVVDGFGKKKKSCISTGVRKPGDTCASPTAMIWP